MIAIIVAGGRGERLELFTNRIPKPMIKVSGKPILLHVVELLKKYGVSEYIFSLCYLPNVVKNYFGDGKKFGIKISYTFEKPNLPLGTAGAISLARKLINDTFIVTYADILRDLDIGNMISFHKKNKSFATLNVYKRESRDAKSKIVLDNKNRIIKFIERPKSDDLKEEYIWVNGSFYILEPQIFDWIPDNKKSDFGKDIFPKLLKSKKPLYAYPPKGYLVDIGNMEKLEYARKTFSKVQFPEVPGKKLLHAK